MTKTSEITTEQRGPTGFATLDKEERRRIASSGGKAAHEKGTAHRFTKDEARTAGTNGGKAIVENKGREHMVEIGRKGGARTSRDRDHMAQIGRKGGQAVSKDREHMAELGRASGEARKASAQTIEETS